MRNTNAGDGYDDDDDDDDDKYDNSGKYKHRLAAGSCEVSPKRPRTLMRPAFGRLKVSSGCKKALESGGQTWASSKRPPKKSPPPPSSVGPTRAAPDTSGYGCSMVSPLSASSLPPRWRG